MVKCTGFVFSKQTCSSHTPYDFYIALQRAFYTKPSERVNSKCREEKSMACRQNAAHNKIQSACKWNLVWLLVCAISTDLEHMKKTDLKVHSKKAGQKQ
jgi:hypothetical protein